MTDSNKSINFSIKEIESDNVRKIIYIGKNKKNPISRILYGNSNRQYVIEFTNLITGKTEYLEMNSDARLVVCGIFYSREEEGAPLITKITRSKVDRTKCTLDMAPGVDALFMVGLIAFFSDRVQFKSKRKITNTRRLSPYKNNRTISYRNNINNNYYYYTDGFGIRCHRIDNEDDLDIDASDYKDYGFDHYIHCDTPAFDNGCDG